MGWQILDVLSEEERRRLLGRSRRRRFARGEIVFHEGDLGDSLHLIDKGHVAVQRSTPLGDIVTLRILGPGEVFGELAVIVPGPRSASVTAVDAAETLHLGAEDFAQVRTNHPAVDRVLLHALAADVRRTSTLLVEALYLSAERRIHLRLLELADLFSAPEGGGPVRIPLTQEQVGQLAGTVRPTANRVLRAAQDEGILRMARGRIEIIDRPKLARRVG